MEKLVKNIVDECVVASDYTDQVLDGLFYNDDFERCSGDTGIPTLVSQLPIVKRIPESELLAVAKKIDRSMVVPSFLHCKVTKPLNFMFLSLPQSEDLKIPLDFAQQTNYVHISPESLLQDEINTGSELGKWIKANEMSSKCITSGVVLKLLAQKMDTLAVRRKGYVLSGFPIFPNRTLTEDIQPLSVAQVKFILELTNTVISKATPQDTETMNKSITDNIVLQASNSSICQLRQNGYDFIDTINLRWPSTANGLRRCIKNQLDFILQLSRQPDIIFHSDLQQCCDKNTDDDDNLMDVVQEFLLHFPTENVMTMDGVSPNEHWRFAVEPKLLESMSFASLEELCVENTVHPGFLWKMSDFGDRCPVAMKEGRLQQGSTEFSVNYRGTIYTLSSQRACEKFLASPEDYVRLRPTCRLAIVGSKTTGKTTLANVLAQLLDGVVVPAEVEFARMVGKLQSVPNGRWILDDMPNETACWDLLARADLTPDVVIILEDKEISNWRSHDVKFRERDHVLRHFQQYFADMVGTSNIPPAQSASTESLKADIAMCTIEEIVQQVCEITTVDDEYDLLKHYCKERGMETLEIDVSIGTWSEVLIGAVSKYLNIFQCQPQLVGESDLDYVVFGSFADFCPVALNDQNILRKGQPNLHIKFRNKSYFLSSTDAMHRFMAQPQLFVKPVGIPPPRICVIGPPGSERTGIACRMAEKYGIPFLERVDVLKTGIEEYIKDKAGFIIDGYPETPEEVLLMAESKYVPELLVNLRDSSTPTDIWTAELDTQIIEVSFGNSVDVTWKRVQKSIGRHMKRDQVLQSTSVLELSTANKLIDAEMFSLSRFGRDCPVRNFENTRSSTCNPSNDSNIYAVLYTDEIYLLEGKDRFRKFCDYPTKYTDLGNRIIPRMKHRIVLIGLPDSNKTTLAGCCAERFGLTLANSSDLVRLQELSGGWVLDNCELTDGFLQTLRECGQEPTAIIVIAEKGELNIARFKNVKYLNISLTKWKMWNEVKTFILDTELGVFEYGQNMNAGRPAWLKHLNVSQMELDAKGSPFQAYCPLCYVDDDKLVCFEHRKDGCDGLPILSGHAFHTNLVQWKQEIYWTCNDHIEMFLNLERKPKKKLPKDLPRLINTDKFDFRVKRDYCVVSTSKNGREKVQGLEKYAVLYMKKIFLMSSKDAALEFLETPENFTGFRFKSPIKPSLRCVLDESAQNLLSQSLKECSKLRPKHRQMTAGVSAAVFIGFYLKANNPANTSLEKEYYQTVFERFFKLTIVRPKKRQFEPVGRKFCAVSQILSNIVATATQPERYEIHKFLEKTVDRTLLASNIRQILSEVLSKVET